RFSRDWSSDVCSSDLEDVDYTRNQIGRFRQLVEPLAASAAVHVHLANSAGLIRFPEASAFATLARPGLALYGVSPLPEIAVDLQIGRASGRDIGEWAQ